jgi:hypothetical protein
MPHPEPTGTWRRHVHAHSRVLPTALAVPGAGRPQPLQPRIPTTTGQVAISRVQTQKPTRGNNPLTPNRSSGMPLSDRFGYVRNRSGSVDLRGIRLWSLVTRRDSLSHSPQFLDPRWKRLTRLRGVSRCLPEKIFLTRPECPTLCQEAATNQNSSD